MTDLTELFKRDAPWSNEATGELFKLVYEELRKMVGGVLGWVECWGHSQ